MVCLAVCLTWRSLKQKSPGLRQGSLLPKQMLVLGGLSVAGIAWLARSVSDVDHFGLLLGLLQLLELNGTGAYLEGAQPVWLPFLRGLDDLGKVGHSVDLDGLGWVILAKHFDGVVGLEADFDGGLTNRDAVLATGHESCNGLSPVGLFGIGAVENAVPAKLDRDKRKRDLRHDQRKG